MAKKAAWTVMAYLAGDNDLTTIQLLSHVIAEFDPSEPHLPMHRHDNA